MAGYQHYDYKQSVIGPIFFGDQLMPGTLEYKIRSIVQEHLKMGILDVRYMKNRERLSDFWFNENRKYDQWDGNQ
jgi:hypothetical protein